MIRRMVDLYQPSLPSRHRELRRIPEQAFPTLLLEAPFGAISPVFIRENL
jgi:hypothetical protein